MESAQIKACPVSRRSKSPQKTKGDQAPLHVKRRTVTIRQSQMEAWIDRQSSIQSTNVSRIWASRGSRWMSRGDGRYASVCCERRRAEGISELRAWKLELAASAEVLSCGLSTRESARNESTGTVRVIYAESHRPYRHKAPATDCDTLQVRKIHGE